MAVGKEIQKGGSSCYCQFLIMRDSHEVDYALTVWYRDTAPSLGPRIQVQGWRGEKIAKFELGEKDFIAANVFSSINASACFKKAFNEELELKNKPTCVYIYICSKC